MYRSHNSQAKMKPEKKVEFGAMAYHPLLCKGAGTNAA